MAKKIRKVCSWCNKVLQENEGEQVDTTHIICPECAERFEQEAVESDYVIPDNFYQMGR